MKRILVIEDESDVREIILDILEAEEFSVIGAENGKEGVRLALEHLPDLVICDVMMPEMDGYDVLKILREEKTTSTIPFVFLTAKATRENIRQGMNLGADDYLTKPFSRKDLLGAISSRIQKKVAIEDRIQAHLNDLRSSLSLSLPHELRTPLNGILISSQLLIEDFAEMEVHEVQPMLADINTSAQRLYRLISNFLLYADLELLVHDSERIKFWPKGSVQDPNALIQKVANETLEMFPERQADLSLKLQQTIAVEVPPDILRKIIEELLNNAFKFSEKLEKVYIKTHQDQQQYYLDFLNQGQGMTDSQITKLGAYKQFDRGRSEHQGSGLGLAIVKRLLDIYKGDLTINSEPNKITTVRVSLPIVNVEVAESSD
ncbi:response regulator [Lyngbya sp. PCC 8106]|uniref:hybrid sensor histidine kinase/response regulator n=1 Tax=Lyngbya sp. (strain PCC 8106) TaxID=313612 RepID=UPI0000EACF4E|nr:response regulator [Lyngbya sp. PCC 8106]EAW33618.1 Response Regulator Receiver Signal Transduction Histidine Kinase [Lyngbya sp. PCC 8106]